MKNNSIFLEHILECIEYIQDYTKEFTKDVFLNSKKVQDAVIRNLEIIGEATKQLSDDFIRMHPETPWRKLAGMRDILIHAYFDVDLDMTWSIIVKDLPILKRQIKELLA